MFYSSPIFVLSLHFLANVHFSSANPDHFGAFDINDYLSGVSGNYLDHEIFSVEEGLKEDIIYVTKRGSSQSLEDCSDCNYFTPWDEDDTGTIFGRSALKSVEDGLNTTQSVTLIPRESNVKSKTITCAGGKVELESYIYPTNEQLAKVYGL
jgi:hypothetical protein